MSSRASSPDSDRAAATVLELTLDCVSLFEGCSSSGQNGDGSAMETRLADLRLWADGVGAMSTGNTSLDWRFRSRPQDLLLVKTILIMLADFIEDYSTLLEASQPVVEAVERIDSTIENLALIGVAIRRTGKASRRRRADTRFDPQDYEDFKRHLECIIILRPSKSGLQSEFNPSSLSMVQKRLIEANLKRRHRFVIAQKRSRKQKGSESRQNANDDSSQGDASSKEEGQVGSQKKRIGSKQMEHQRAPPTRGGLTAASTAEGTLQYVQKRKYVPGAARTQITALAADAEFPRPPPNPEGRRIGKCPCCCQSILIEEMMDPNKWRQHIIEDLLPYTCIIEDCPTQTVLFSTRKEWEAHVKTDHEVQWHCPLCEENDLTFDTEEAIVNHFRAEHEADVRELTLETLLPWSETRSMGITACPLCSSYGREDSPEIVDHVLRHVYEFSLRALPWTKPSTHRLSKQIGTYNLPKKDEATKQLVEWIDEANCGTATQLQLSASENGNQEMDVLEDVYDMGYVPDDEYFDDESVGKSSRPQWAQTEPSGASDSVGLSIPSATEASAVSDLPGDDHRNQFDSREFLDTDRRPPLPAPTEASSFGSISPTSSHGTWSELSDAEGVTRVNQLIDNAAEAAAETPRKSRMEQDRQDELGTAATESEASSMNDLVGASRSKPSDWTSDEAPLPRGRDDISAENQDQGMPGQPIDNKPEFMDSDSEAQLAAQRGSESLRRIGEAMTEAGAATDNGSQASSRKKDRTIHMPKPKYSTLQGDSWFPIRRASARKPNILAVTDHDIGDGEAASADEAAAENQEGSEGKAAEGPFGRGPWLFPKKSKKKKIRDATAEDEADLKARPEMRRQQTEMRKKRREAAVASEENLEGKTAEKVVDHDISLAPSETDDSLFTPETYRMLNEAAKRESEREPAPRKLRKQIRGATAEGEADPEDAAAESAVVHGMWSTPSEASDRFLPPETTPRSGSTWDASLRGQEPALKAATGDQDGSEDKAAESASSVGTWSPPSEKDDPFRFMDNPEEAIERRRRRRAERAAHRQQADGDFF